MNPDNLAVLDVWRVSTSRLRDWASSVADGVRDLPRSCRADALQSRHRQRWHGRTKAPVSTDAPPGHKAAVEVIMDLGVTSAPWPGAIRPHSTPGLSTCVDERRLCSDGLPVPVSLLEAEALRLAEWAFARREPLVLCPADPLVPMAALIAAAVHIADMAQHHRVTGQYAGSSRRVAVVTSDFHLRGTYRGLGIRNPVSRTVATLRDVVPAATVGDDGVVRVLSADPRNGWSTVFAPSIQSLASLRGIDLVVVVPPAGSVREALALGIPSIVIAADPSDPALAEVAHTTATFCWDLRDVARAEAAGLLTGRLARRLRGDRHEVVAVPAQSVCENAALFWQDIGPLTRASARSTVARGLAREAFGLFHDLSGLALPLADYERLSAPVRVRLDAIGAAVRWTKGEARDLYLPMAEAELRDLAAALSPLPPKREVLLRVLGEALDDHADVLLITRTAELARVHRADLDQHGLLAKVRVTSLGALAGEEPADVAVLTGMAPAWARWVYRAGVATELKVLAYSPEGTVESVAHGYNESEMVRRAIALQVTREEWLARPSAKDRSWSRLTGEPRQLSDDASQPPLGTSGAVNVRTSAPPDVPPGLWDGDKWFADLTRARPDDERGGRVGTNGANASVVVAVRVVFDGGRWALLDTAGTVTRLGAGSGTAQPATPVSALVEGDRVLFFDGDGRKDLLGKVLEVAGDIPALAVSAAWVGYWRRALATAYRRFGTYTGLADALMMEGCTVQAQTVRLWVVGVTIGPEDDEDVRRLGEVIGDATLRDKYQEVCRAFRTLRGAHIRLSKRLTDIAVQVGAGIAGGALGDDEVVDQRTGLTVADFRESLEVLAVDRIHQVGEVPYVLVGQLHDPEIAEEQ